MNKIRKLPKNLEEQIPQELQKVRLFIEANKGNLEASKEETPEPGKKTKTKPGPGELSS